MSDSQLPENVRILLRAAVPNVSALELLLFFATRPGQSWRNDEIAGAIWPAALTPSAAKDYVEHFRECKLVVLTGEDRIQFQPATAELAETVAALVKLYVEKPVSIMRAIYSSPDSKIQSFADAFRIRRDSA